MFLWRHMTVLFKEILFVKADKLEQRYIEKTCQLFTLNKNSDVIESTQRGVQQGDRP
jgi:hypothetical protein